MSYASGYQQKNINLETDSENAGAQTARIVVGNALAGDTVDDVDFLDTGNGAGVAAALASAGASVTPTDVYVKSGIYDVSLAGAPVLPMAIPEGLMLWGAGEGIGSGNGTIFRASGTQRALFVAGDDVTLQHIGIEVPAATAGAVGTSVIFGGLRLNAQHLQFLFTGVGVNADESLTAALRLQTQASLDDVVVTGLGYSTVAGTLACIAINGPPGNNVICDGCFVTGLDNGYVMLNGNRAIFTGCRAGQHTAGAGFILLGGANRVDACYVRNSERGVVLSGSGDEIAVNDTTFSGITDACIDVLGGSDFPTLCDNLFSLSLIGIRLSTTDSPIIGPSQFSSVTTHYSITGATNIQQVEPRSVSFGIRTTPTTANPGEILRYDASGGAFTLSAPSASRIMTGSSFSIKEMAGDATAITVDGNGNFIQDPTTGALAASVSVAAPFAATNWFFDGTNWLTY